MKIKLTENIVFPLQNEDEVFIANEIELVVDNGIFYNRVNLFGSTLNPNEKSIIENKKVTFSLEEDGLIDATDFRY